MCSGPQQTASHHHAIIIIIVIIIIIIIIIITIIIITTSLIIIIIIIIITIIIITTIIIIIIMSSPSHAGPNEKRAARGAGRFKPLQKPIGPLMHGTASQRPQPVAVRGRLGDVCCCATAMDQRHH
eukprot:COSAG06_NODE_2643_length_6515_cov_5.207294_5_plen_126_part_00